MTDTEKLFLQRKQKKIGKKADTKHGFVIRRKAFLKAR